MKAIYKNHKGNPANQPFNVSARKNLTKKNAWWQVGKSNKAKKGN